MKFKLVERKLPNARFSITWLFYSVETPFCNICKKSIEFIKNVDIYFYICDNGKCYHEDCFNKDDFNIQHDKLFKDYRHDKLHMDRLVLLKIMDQNTYDSFVMEEQEI